MHRSGPRRCGPEAQFSVLRFARAVHNAMALRRCYCYIYRLLPNSRFLERRSQTEEPWIQKTKT